MNMSEPILRKIAWLAAALACASGVKVMSGEQQLDPAPRVLGTAQSEEEFDAYSSAVSPSAPRTMAQAAEKFLQQYPSSGLAPYVHQSAARAYYQLGNMSQVAQHGEAALKDLPGNALLLSLVSAAYLKQGLPEKSVDRARIALAAIAKLQPPPSAEHNGWQAQVNKLKSNLHLTLGSALLEISQQDPHASAVSNWLKDSATNLQEFLAANPQSETGSYRLAEAFAAEHDSPEAIHYYAWTVALAGPDSQVARAKLEDLCRSEKRSAQDAIAAALSEIKLRTDGIHAQGSERE
jgi:tetratricopeptide (TPR) repeat protein